MVRELYLKYKDRYFKDFFTPEVRDLPKDKKELLLKELETMRKNKAAIENRRDHAAEEDWEEEVWACDKALENTLQRGIIAAHLTLDYPNKHMLSTQEVLEILDTSCSVAKEKQSDLYHAMNQRWPWHANNYTVSDSGKVFYGQCMEDYCNSRKRERFLNIVCTPKARKIKTSTLAKFHQEMDR